MRMIFDLRQHRIILLYNVSGQQSPVKGKKSTSDRKCRKSGKMAILRDGLRPREKRFELFHCRRFTKFGKLLQQKQQIPKGIKTI